MDEQGYKLQRIKEISSCYRLLDLYLTEANSQSSWTDLCSFKDWLLKQQYRQIQEIRDSRDSYGSINATSHPE